MSNIPEGLIPEYTAYLEAKRKGKTMALSSGLEKWLEGQPPVIQGDFNPDCACPDCCGGDFYEETSTIPPSLIPDLVEWLMKYDEVKNGPVEIIMLSSSTLTAALHAFNEREASDES